MAFFDYSFLFHFVIVVFLGAVLGSFATALTWRSATQKSWRDQIGLKSRSTCTACNKTLSFLDLIPVLSWCFIRGKCRHCGAKISPLYPIIEVTSILLCLAVFFQGGLTVNSVLLMLSLPFLMALFIVDLRHMILPDILVLCFALFGVLFVAFNNGFEGLALAVFSATIFGLLLWGVGKITTKFVSKDALGFGDVKFFAAAGLWLGLSQLAYMMILSGVIGIALALAWRVVKKEEYFPFGPALISATYILLLINV